MVFCAFSKFFEFCTENIQNVKNIILCFQCNFFCVFKNSKIGKKTRFGRFGKSKTENGPKYDFSVEGIDTVLCMFSCGGAWLLEKKVGDDGVV